MGFPAGKIGRRQVFYSSLAQLVERTAVNRDVASSSLARGAKKAVNWKLAAFFIGYDSRALLPKSRLLTAE